MLPKTPRKQGSQIFFSCNSFLSFFLFEEKEVENRVDEEQDFRILSRVEEDVQENIESLIG